MPSCGFGIRAQLLVGPQEDGKRNRLQPLLSRMLQEMIARKTLAKRKAQGLKSDVFSIIHGPTKEAAEKSA
jgi:hypothetical protein